MASVLVVDDQKALRKNLAFYLKSQGLDVDTAESGEEALEKMHNTHFEIIISDYKMDRMNGFDLMKKAKQLHPTSEFIMMTAYGNIPLAVDVIKNGAADFISKPFEYVTILEKIERLLKKSRFRSHGDEERQCEIIAESQKMKDIRDLAIKAAGSDITVLIEGEYGTGKSLLARMIHNLSNRSEVQMITVECSNASDSALEREIFGSGAGEPGALAMAAGGTVFFRDVDRLVQGLQLKLLLFLREGAFHPVNSSAPGQSDARVIASTTRNLKRMVDSGTFREDLYYQLDVMPVYMPPLRSRIGDLEPLIKHFLQGFRKKLGKNLTGISPDAMLWMKTYEWPGNLQELENILARACGLATGEILDESLIFTLPQDRPVPEEIPGFLNMTLKDNQKTLILKALKQNNHNYSRTATQLGISRTTLWRRMKRFKIEGLQVEK